MAHSPEPSVEKPVNEELSSGEEESDDEGSESHSSGEEKEKYSNDFSGETGQDEDEDLKLSKSKIDSKSVNQGTDSNSESDLGSPSSYKLQPVSRVSKSTSKRTIESQSPVINSKKSKSEEGKSVGSSSHGGCINRLWSDKDEITVLNGLIEIKNNIGALHNFIKGKLEADFSKDQLNSKIRRMKKRFLNVSKKNENGEDPVFSKPREDKVFELSKRIWGGCIGIEKVELDGREIVKDENDGDEKVELDGKEIMEDENDGDEGDFFGTKYPFLSNSFENLSSVMPPLDMSKSGMSFTLSRLSSSKAKELDERWKLLIKEEFELNHKKLTLMKEQMNMALHFDE